MYRKYSATGRRLKAGAATVLAAALVVAQAGLMASCSRKAKATGQAAQGSSQRSAVAPAPSIFQGIEGQLSQKAPQPSPAPKAAAAESPLAASIRAFGLGLPSKPRIAWDFSLGALQSYAPAEGDEGEVLAAARSFMDGLAEGKLDPELLLPEARDALSVLLAPPAPGAKAKVPYRLGAIAVWGEDASLRVRLPSELEPSDPKSVREEGLLSLRKAGGSWYVEALALDPPRTGALAFDADPRARGALKD
jgi:hypothetical protein